MSEEVLLAAIRSDPSDALAYRAVADWLEEDGQPERAELLRLDLALREMGRGDPGRPEAEGRLRGLLAAGVRPCIPTLDSGLGMAFALIPAGRFLMGSAEGEVGRGADEGPRHEVEITRPFYLGVHPVTVGQFRAFADEAGYRTEAERGGGAYGWTGSGWAQVARYNWRNPGFAQGEDHPVVCVSWGDAGAFCQWLSKKIPGQACRLPTEAEWEYGCRGPAGSSTPFHLGTSLSSDQANFNGERPYGGAPKGPYRKATVPAASFAPNGWGLYQTHGNVWEWCADRYSAVYYQRSPPADPPGPPMGSNRVVRGGGWYYSGRVCRSARRGGREPTFRIAYLGFRLALVPSAPGRKGRRARRGP